MKNRRKEKTGSGRRRKGGWPAQIIIRQMEPGSRGAAARKQPAA